MEGACGVRSVDESIARLQEDHRREWACKARDIFSKYIETKDEEGLWTLAKRSKDKTVESFYVKNMKKFMAKGIATFSSRPESVMKFYSKISNRPLFDTWFEDAKEFEIIKDPIFDVTFSVMWILRKGKGSFKSRDAVVFTMKFQVGAVLYMVAHSIQHPDFPEQKLPIRAKVDFMINEARPNPKRKGTLFTRMLRADPKEKIPQLFKEKLIEQAGMELLKVREALEK